MTTETGSGISAIILSPVHQFERIHGHIYKVIFKEDNYEPDPDF